MSGSNIVRSGRLAAVRDLLPRGGLLPDEAWDARHRWALRLLVVHAAAIFAFAMVRGLWPPHAAAEASIPLLAALLASREHLGRRARAIAASFGLLSCSAILVHLSGGFIEMHFHFFVMIIVISLYQDWASFLLAFAYVVVHHGAVGAIDPASVYNHSDAIANPWKWAMIHGLFIAGASVASLANWRLSEDTTLARLASERRARVTAEAGMKLREDFLSIATHELRTPVASVKGYTQLALRGFRSGEDARADRVGPTLEALDRQADRLARLVTQLLDASRIEAGQLEIEPLRTDVGVLVLNVVQTLQQSAGPAYSWEVDVPTGIEAVVDPARLEQVVANLVENAVRYSPDGGRVGVRLRRADRDIRLEVRDAGVGIDPGRLPRIFDRFYQAHRERNLGGMGLGLYVAREIVARHGGRIDVVSHPGEGSRFTVVIPAREVAPRGMAPGAPSGGSAVSVPTLAGATVLVIEDDPGIRDVVVTVLREEGYATLEARSGADGLAILARERPDLILLDKQMPDMDGTVFADAYRDRPGPQAAIVALCAARDAAEWSARIGAVAYVTKPFDLEELLATVARHVRRPAAASVGLGPVDDRAYISRNNRESQSVRSGEGRRPGQ